MLFKKILLASVTALASCVLYAEPVVLFQSPASLKLKQHPCSMQPLPIVQEAQLIKALDCDYPQHDVLEITKLPNKPGFVQVKLLQEQKSHIFYRTVHFATGLTEKEGE